MSFDNNSDDNSDENCDEERRELAWLLEKKAAECDSKAEKIWQEYYDIWRASWRDNGTAGAEDPQVAACKDSNYVALRNKADELRDMAKSLREMSCKKIRKLLEEHSSPKKKSLDDLVNEATHKDNFVFIRWFKDMSIKLLIDLLPPLLQNPASLVNISNDAKDILDRYSEIVKEATTKLGEEFDNMNNYLDYIKNQYENKQSELNEITETLEKNTVFIQENFEHFQDLSAYSTEELEEIKEEIINGFLSLVVYMHLTKIELEVLGQLIQMIIEEIKKRSG